MRLSSFTALNISQTMVVLNDAIFRLLVVFSLIEILGAEASNRILGTTAVLFVLPFLVFSMPSGELADKYSKRTIIIWMLVAEIVGCGIGVIGMYMRNVFLTYFSLYAVAMQAAVFNPSKYGIIPELVKREKVTRANSWMTLSSYLAIILGTFLASFSTQMTDRNYALVALFCTIISCFALFFGFFIEKTPKQNPSRKIHINFFPQIFHSLRLSSKYPYLLLSILSSSYFVFTAGYTQLNMIPLGIQSLNITDVQAGYIFLAAALGVGIGSIIVAIFSKYRPELGLSMLGAFGTAVSYIVVATLHKSLIGVVVMIMFVGINGGMYVVPLDSYIQVTSPDKERGYILAASNFCGYTAVLGSAFFLIFFGEVLKLSAATGFMIIGLLTLLVSVNILFRMPEMFMGFFSRIFSSMFLHIQKGKLTESSVYIAHKPDLVTLVSCMMFFSRVRFIIRVRKKLPLYKRLYYILFNIIPIYESMDSKRLNKVISSIQVLQRRQYTLILFSHLDNHEKVQGLTLREVFGESASIVPLIILKRHDGGQKTAFFHPFAFLHHITEVSSLAPIDHRLSMDIADLYLKEELEKAESFL